MTWMSVLPALLATGFALQPPGTFHGNEPVARDGERWLALRVDARGAALIETTMQVRAVEDAVLDASGERSGREVGSPLGEAGIVAYLRGPGLRSGPVEQATVTAASTDAAPAPVRMIALHVHRYRLETRCDATPLRHVDAQPQHRCRFLLDDGRRAQTVLEANAWYEPGVARLVTDAPAEVLFAGDLDRDGRPDLVIDLTDHYNVARPTLLLSSQAAAGQLVGVAAVFESVGC
jgi:hypothetical protein